jgi:chromatin remodeling complex protein RSC6
LIYVNDTDPKPRPASAIRRIIGFGFKAPMTAQKKQPGFARPLTLSTELAAVIGSTPQPRTAVTKLLWDYIKKNNLQNPQNKRNILCDAKLQAVLGKPEVTMFEMTALVGKHLS